jgi:hypothetical protein
MEAMKRCPYCGEEILAVAIKCKHCGSALTAEATPPPRLPAAPNAAPKDCGWILLGIPLAGTVLIWGWIGNMLLIQGPESKLALVVAAVVISTAAVATFERSKAASGPPRANGPGQWGAFVLFMWIIGYPAYLFSRSRCGLSNKLWQGIAVTVLFAGSAIAAYSAIESKMQEVRASLEQAKEGIEQAQRSFEEARSRLGTFSSAPDAATSPAESSPARELTAAEAMPAQSVLKQSQPPAQLAPQTEQEASPRIERYCKKLAGLAGGSYMLEQGCHQNETEAWRWLRAHAEVHTIPARIINYCSQSVFDESFMMKRGCVENELAAKQSLNQGEQ